MEKLYKEALKAFNNAYAPYSNFHVGAAVLLKDGTIVSGANVENASYGLSNCAERTALFKVYALGYRKDDIVKMLVLADTLEPVSPCGACRQVMSELLNEDTPIILTNLKKVTKQYTIKELLPFSFKESDMDDVKK